MKTLNKKFHNIEKDDYGFTLSFGKNKNLLNENFEFLVSAMMDLTANAYYYYKHTWFTSGYTIAEHDGFIMLNSASLSFFGQDWSKRPTNYQEFIDELDCDFDL